MTETDPKDTRETVVLLHGVLRTRRCMIPLAAQVEQAGYRVVNRTYPSRTTHLEQLAGNWLPGMLSEHATSAAPRVHFVAHSMGSLIVRHLMAHARPANVGRLVFLGPPSRGSELADRGQPRWLFNLVVGANLRALGKADDAFWRSLPQSVDYPLGIVIGTGRGNPFGRNLPKPNDGTVTVAETRIDGAADSIEVPFSHAGMLRKQETAEQVLHFLRAGRFNHARRQPV